MNCAEMSKGGWWYGRCYDIHPTGMMNPVDPRTGMATSQFHSLRKSSLVQLKALKIKIKPQICLEMVASSSDSCLSEVVDGVEVPAA